MGQISKFLRKTDSGYAHWCPACEEMHNFYVDKPTRAGARWSFDGNVGAPTFNPSMRISSPACDWGDGEHSPATCCHYFCHGGKLQFCADCTHSLAGQTVDLPELSEHVRDNQ